MSKISAGLGQTSDGSDDLKEIDRAMLIAVARHHGGNAPLSLDQERLLDDWFAGCLSPADADRAADLTKRSTFAAERVLERRLVDAANAGPGVPAALAVQVLQSQVLQSQIFTASRHAKAETRKSFQFWLRSFTGLQWSAAGAAFAATIAFAVFGFQASQERWQSDQRIQVGQSDQRIQVGQSEQRIQVEPSEQRIQVERQSDQPIQVEKQSDQRIQVAMVTIDDRRPLSGTSRTRALQNRPLAPAENAFRDVDVPADVLRHIIVDAGSADRSTAASQLTTYLPLTNAAGQQAQILIDSALADRLEGEWKDLDVISIRIYDLDDARTAAIRRAINTQVANSLLLLTLRP